MGFKLSNVNQIPLVHKLIYGLGAFVNNLLAAAIGGMVIVLNLGLGMNPALVGLLGAIPRLTDAITDPLMGFISDNTRSRWGRRRPYIFIGAIVAGLSFALLWQFPSNMSENFYFWFFLLGSFVFYLGYTIFATPWVALGYELTADYHERTRLMGVQNFLGQLAYVISPWFLVIMQAEMFDDMVEGASYLAIGIGLITIIIGILPAIYLRERFAKGAKQGISLASSRVIDNVKAFLKGFALTLSVKPFRYLCYATFLVFNGFMLIAAFSSYVIIYYVFSGDIEMGAEYAGWAGSVGAVSTFIVIALVSMLSSRIGKRKTFFVAMWLSIVGYALKWVCYSPDMPWLVVFPAPFMAFGLGALFTLMGSMMADVCDYDELQTGQRREGMFGSIYWWVVKLGMAAALAASGFLLNATGFDVALKGAQTDDAILLMRLFDVLIPIVATLLAVWAIKRYDLTEHKANEIRETLELRRGDNG